MNLFLLHPDYPTAAKILLRGDPVRARCQLKEACQILAAVEYTITGYTRMRRKDGNLYEITHQNHPIIKQAVKGRAQWLLAVNIARTLADVLPNHACSRSFYDWYTGCTRRVFSEEGGYVCTRLGHKLVVVDKLIDYAALIQEYMVEVKGFPQGILYEV